VRGGNHRQAFSWRTPSLSAVSRGRFPRILLAMRAAHPEAASVAREILTPD